MASKAVDDPSKRVQRSSLHGPLKRYYAWHDETKPTEAMVTMRTINIATIQAARRD